METDISKDGKELAFVPMDGGLSVLNIDRGEITVLTKDAGISRPLWSPDGQWIAFVTFDNGKGEAKLNIIHPDGTGRREVGIGANGRDLAGWYPDSEALLIQASDDDQIIGLNLKKVDLATDTATPIAPNIVVEGAAFSPDGVWVAYQYQEFGRNGPWIYIARLDGSDRRLLVKLDGRWSGGDPVWSPDSKWLSFSVTDMQNRDQPFGRNAILNPNTCEVIPLPGVDGAIKSWIS
jgi:TolB protein